jgi:uncharacterized protein YcbX
MGERLEQVRLDTGGLDRDRTFGPWDVDAARFLTVDDCPQLRLAQARTDGGGLIARLPDGAEVVVGAPSADAAFSSWLDRQIEMRSVPAAGGHGSGWAIRLVSLSSIAALARQHPSGQWDARRFRPHLVVVVPGVEFGEDAWVGSPVRAGSAEIQIDGPIAGTERWGVAQIGLAADTEIAATVRSEHDGTLGVAGSVVEVGVVELGDPVEPVPR